MKTIQLFIVIFITALSSFSQSWQHAFGGSSEEVANAVVQTADGGFITAGYTTTYGAGKKDVYVVKTDVNGKMIWQQVVGGGEDDIANAIVESNSGDYFVAGETKSSGNGGTDVYLVKLGSNGDLKWAKTFGGIQDDNANGIVLTSTGQPVLAGSTKSFGAGLQDVFLLKVDTAGNSIWQKTYGKTGDDFANGIAKVHDGGFVIAGRTTSFGSNKGYGIRTNANGDSLWTRSFYLQTVTSSMLKAVTELRGDSNFVFAGYGGSFWVNTATIKTDLNGNIRFTHYSSLLDDGAYSITATHDGGFATAGFYSNYGTRTLMIKYDVNGAEEFQRTYQYSGGSGYGTSSYGTGICETADSGYAISGLTYLATGTLDFLLIKTDATGIFMDVYFPLTVTGPVTVCENDSVRLSAPPGFDAYQYWYYGPNHATYIIAGANDSIFYAKTSGSYACFMSDEDGIYVCSGQSVTIIPVPTASITPTGTVNFCLASNDTTLTANVVTGADYQWNMNGIPIPGATLSTYQPQLSGSYTVTISDSCGTATSATTVVNTTAPPAAVIYGGWGGIAIIEGYHCYGVDISTTAQPGNTYQWNRGGIPIPNQIYNTICVMDTGTYTVIVSNACGSVTSNAVSIGASYDNFQISSGPTSGCGVDSVLLSAQWTNINSLQWYFNGTIINGAVYDTLMARVSGNYSCQCTFSCPDCDFTYYWQGGDQVNVTINHNPKPFITANGPISMCAGNVDLLATAGATAYQWYKNYSQISGATQQTYTVSSAGNYYCNITTPQCGLVSSNRIDVWYGLPSGNIRCYSPTICTGMSTNIRVNSPSAGTTYQWQLNGTGIAGATSSSYNAAQSGNYTCMFTNGCGSDTSNIVVISVLSPPPNSLSPSGTLNICTGDSITLTAPTGPGYTYSWRKNNSTISGATGNTYTASANGIYTAYIQNGGCATLTFGDTINVVMLPVNNIWPSTPPVFCGNDSVVLNANTGTGYTYQWYYNSNLIASATEASYAATLTGEYTVWVSNATGCNDESQPFYVNANYISNLGITLSGLSVICLNDSVQLTVSPPGVTYQWELNGVAINGATGPAYFADTAGIYNVNVTNLQGCIGSASATVSTDPGASLFINSVNANCAANDGMVNLYASSYYGVVAYNWSNGATTEDLSGLSPGIYTVTVTDAIGCIASASDTVGLNTNLPPAVMNVTDSAICAGQTTVINVNTVVNATYQWELNGSVIAGATNYYYGVSQGGVYDCVVSNSCGNTTSDLVTVTQDTIPTALIASTSTTVCSGSAVLFTADSAVGYTYQWKRNANIISGATSSSYSATVGGNYTCLVSNSCGTSTSNMISLSVHLPYNASISTNDSTIFCAGGSAILIANTGSGISYQWLLNGAVIPGAVATSYSAQGSGVYSCAESNACLDDTSNAIAVTVIPVPSISISASATIFCNGDSVILSATASPGTPFQWRRNGVYIGGATDSFYVAVNGGTYNCISSNVCGFATSNTLVLTKDSVPVPSISGFGLIHICQGDTAHLSTALISGYTYQWLRNFQPVAGATSNLYSATVTGRYRVQVTDSNGCQNISGYRVVLVGCYQHNPPPPPNRNAYDISTSSLTTEVFPNPTNGLFNLRVIFPGESKYSFSLHDVLGREIVKWNEIPIETSFSFGDNLFAGIYFVEIFVGDLRKTIRVIKQQ